MSKNKTEKTVNREQYNRNTHKIYKEVASILRNSSLEFTKISTSELKFIAGFPVIEFTFKASLPRVELTTDEIAKEVERLHGNTDIIERSLPKNIGLDDINLLRSTFNMIADDNDSCDSCIITTHQKNRSDDILMTCKFMLIEPTG